MAWQQFTGPITAKGVEDSGLYVYNALISLNEVGGDPARPGLGIEKFHEYLRHRRSKWPFTLNATMTHDTKRGEDARARINVLSEFPQEWERSLENWTRWNDSKCRVVRGIRAPERNEETLLYQTLIGSWPGPDLDCACYTRRVQEFMVKAVREAMVHTRWTVPNLEHEKALTDFVASILTDSPQNEFLPDFKRFASKISYHGALNSLSQLAVKIASPGVADFYQGTELWDLRLVDPDNRRDVNFSLRADLLGMLQKEKGSLATLLESWQDGRIKLYLTQKGLQFRRDYPALVLSGDYFPLAVEGPHKDCILAFARRYRGEWCVLVVPRFTSRLVDENALPVGKKIWRETQVLLPKTSPKRWTNTFTGEPAVSPGDGTCLFVGDVLRSCPVGILVKAAE